jgi:putative acetyltransferase
MKLSTYSKTSIKEIQQLFYTVFSDSEGEEQGLSVSTIAYDLMMNTEPKDFVVFTTVESDQIIGSIFFSKLTFENQAVAFILSPVAIHTQYQGKGIGQELINFGVSNLKDKGVELLFTYGSPQYYSKVGFSPISEEIAQAPVKLSLPFAWLGQSLVSDEIDPIAGGSRCVEALNNPEYW